MRVVYIDFEFNEIVESHVNLVCAATYDTFNKQKKKWWLHNNPEEQHNLCKFLEYYDLVIGYSCVAEARSFLALRLDPLKWKWIDLFIEYRLISNHNDRMNWGKQLVDGRVKFVTKPKPSWERSDSDEKTVGFKPTHSLAEATYKLTGTIRDTKHKTEMRDLIISNPKRFTPSQAEDIMDYCLEDVVFLPKIFNAIKKEYKALVKEDFEALRTYNLEAMERGRYSAHTALMENRGYPIDLHKTKNFSSHVQNILYDAQRELNTLFPDIKPFRWNARENRFSLTQKNIKDWIKDHHDIEYWPKTKGKDISLKLEAWEKYYNFKHDYPKDNFGAQMVRFGKLKQTMYGFSQKKGGKKNFWDSVGSDGRVRPYMNHFGAQSSRSQPGATGFMFLKPAWMRSLVVPEEDFFCGGIDYGAQEFFASALLSGDTNMISAYLSGDPYLAFGKLAGMIPKDGTKQSHKYERDLCKSTVLGISYLMSKYGLAIKLTNDTGREWDHDEAQEQIDLFYEAFSALGDYQQNIIDMYAEEKVIKLPCGWRMWGDNPNHRSVANVPIQGFGGTVMRKAVDIAWMRGVNIMFTLHDALYMEDRCGREHMMFELRESMRDAFVFYMPEDLKKYAAQIRLDPFIWSPNYEPDSEMKIGDWKVPASNLYIDERAGNDYQMFSKYFEDPIEDCLK